MSVFFNGQQLVTPTVQSVVDDSAMVNRNLTVGNKLVVIGRSTGGKPKTALEFNSPVAAKRALKGGELLKAVEMAFAPSSEVPGPSSVIVIRVNPATQASLVLKDAGAADAISLKSTDYGLYTNQINAKVESGTNKGKKLTVTLGNDYYYADDVDRDAFKIQYGGAEATAVMTVSNTSVVLEAPTSTIVATLDLTVYDTVQKLVDAINAVADFTASVVAGSANTAALNGLDAVTDQDVKSSEYTAKATLQAVIDWINGVGEGFLDATRPAAANLPPANIATTYLSGGSDGTVQNSDWTDCFTELQGQDVQWVVALSSTAAIHAMAQTHCEFMSNAGKMERRAFVGGSKSESTSTVAAAAAALNSDRVAQVYPAIYDYDASGLWTLYEPYYLASIVAAMFAGADPGEPMTNKSVNVRGVEVQLAAPTDTDYLIRSGVLAVRKTSRGHRIVKSISTWLNDSKYNRVEISTGAATDFVARNVREALERFVGRKGSPVTVEEARSVTDTTLRELAREAPAGPGVIVGDDLNPAYQNITVELTGDVLRVEFQCSPVIPINYVLVTIHAVPFSTVL